MERSSADEISRDGMRDRIKKFARAGIVAAGALMPSGLETSREIPSQAPATTYEEVMGEQDPNDTTVTKDRYQGSPMYQRGMEIVRDENVSWNESSKQLSEILRSMVDQTERTALLKAFSESFVEFFPDQVLSFLEEHGVDVEKESWVTDVLGKGLVNYPKQVVNTFFNQAEGTTNKDAFRSAEIYGKWRDILAKSADPRTKTALTLLEHDGPETDPRLFFFLDEIGSGQWSVDEAKALISDKGKLFTELSRKALESGTPTDDIFETLNDAVEDDPERRSILKLMPGYHEWKAGRAWLEEMYPRAS